MNSDNVVVDLEEKVELTKQLAIARANEKKVEELLKQETDKVKKLES